MLYNFFRGFGICFNISRIILEERALLADCVYEKERAQIFHLTAVLKEHANGGFLIVARSGSGSRRSFGRSWRFAVCLARELFLCLLELLNKFVKVEQLVFAADIILNSLNLRFI